MPKIDPERNITITLPIWMVEKLVKIKPTLSMFKDEADVSAVIEIIDAIYAGSLEFIRQEEGELMDYLSEPDDLLDSDDDDEDEGKADK